MVNIKNRFWEYLFYSLIGFHVLYQLGFGAMTLVNPQSLQEPYGFDSQSSPQIFLIVLILSFGQFFLTAIAILSIYWTNKKHSSGAVLGICLGLYFLLLGIAGIWTVDNRITLYIDVVRGLFTILSGFIILKNAKK